MNRRIFLRGSASAALALRAIQAQAQAQAQAQTDWPARTVRLVAPYGAGGSNDISARILADQLSHRSGQQFVVENKPGAGTRIANEAVARAKADGYTFLYAAAPYSTVESLYGKLAYDPRTDLKPVVFCTVAPIFLIVNAQSSCKSAKELIDYGKSKPDGLTFASPGAGSVPHLAAELLFREANVKGLNVHYRGDATAYTELVAGRVDATLTAISSALPFIQEGRLRVLGVASEVTSAVYPQAPTLREQGLANVVAAGWTGIMAPASTPESIIVRLGSEVNSVLSDPAIKRKLLALGLEAKGGSEEEFGKFIVAESKRWGEVIRAANIRGE